MDISLEYCELVQDDKSLVCPICQCIFLSPQQVSCCKQHICKTCIDKVKNRCPLCRHRPLRYQDAKSEFISSINKALIWCKHKKNGCDWKGELQCLDVHLRPSFKQLDANPNAGCQYEHVPCPLRCGKQIPRWKCLRHELLSCSQSVQSRLRKLEKRQLKMLSEADMRAKLTSVKMDLEKQIEAVSECLKTEAALKLQAEVRAQKEELRRLEEYLSRIERTLKVSKKTSSQGVSETSNVQSLIQKRLDSLEMKMTSMLTEWENTVGRFQLDTKPLNKQITTINEKTKKLEKRLDQLEDNMTQPQVNVTRRSDQVEDNMMHRQSHVTVTEIRRRLDQLEDNMMHGQLRVNVTEIIRRLDQLEDHMIHIRQSRVNVIRRLRQLENSTMYRPRLMIFTPAAKINYVVIVPLLYILLILLLLSLKYVLG